MRPDEHKAKQSRRYQAKKKLQGDTSAAEAEERRREAAKARDRGQGVNAILRRNGQLPELSEEEILERQQKQAKFSRRKLVSNTDRYKEETNEEIMARDVEMGIDRETTDLISMLEEADDNRSSSLFKFKEEQLYEEEVQEDLYRNMLQIDFNLIENVLRDVDIRTSLQMNEVDSKYIQNALEDYPVTLDKPIIPAFSKNGRGYVLFKAQQSTTTPIKDGIYLRNDGSNHPKPVDVNRQKDTLTDDLDELLAIDNAPVKKTAATIPQSGSIKKPAPKKEATVDEDEAWLDDILG
ncbi:hypothetical protein BDB01DRAFT_768774 [Pilobolus umbonatus]|nr:hypothetical protein BDB01DRAFT_768774 [Pilobolus umbonatus]